MISYHGGPIWPEQLAARVWKGRHAMVSFSRPEQINTAAAVAESFVLDNGAFTAWRGGRTPDWEEFYRWVDEWRYHPGFDWALIPDVIDGSEADNDKLVFNQWPHSRNCGVPVWHLHESLNRLQYLSSSFPRVALGSSGQYSTPGTASWWQRMTDVMETICDSQGRPMVKLHGLRMLNRRLREFLPLASADSTNIALNVGKDVKWKGTYSPSNKEARAEVLISLIEDVAPAAVWQREIHIQDQLRLVCSPPAP